MSACAGREFAHPEAVDLVLHALPWNAAMTQLINEDPVVQAVQETLAAAQAGG